MSRLQAFSTDTDGIAGNVRLVFIADVRSNRGLSRPAASAGGPLHSYPRPLTVAEVLPPTLRSGSYPGDENAVIPWPLHPKPANTPKMFWTQGQPANVYMQPTPNYPPGRAFAPEERYGAFGAETPVTRAAPSAGRNEASRSLGNDLFHAQHGTPLRTPVGEAGASSPTFLKASHAPFGNPSGTNWSSPGAPEAYAVTNMLPGETLASSVPSFANHSTTSWLPEPTAAVQASFRAQTPAALTSTLVSRMEALRAQLLKVSSTLSGVQERAAHLSTSMGHRSHSLLQQTPSGATVAAAGTFGAPPPPVIPPAGTVPPAWQAQPPSVGHHQQPFPYHHPQPQPVSYQHQPQQNYGTALPLRTASSPGSAHGGGVGGPGFAAGPPYAVGGGLGVDVPYGRGGSPVSAGDTAPASAGDGRPGSRVYVVSVSRAAEPPMAVTATAQAVPPPSPYTSPYSSYPTQSHMSMTFTPVMSAGGATSSPPPSYLGSSGGGGGYSSEQQQPQGVQAPYAHHSYSVPGAAAAASGFGTAGATRPLSQSLSAASSTAAAVAAAAAAAAAAVAVGPAGFTPSTGASPHGTGAGEPPPTSRHPFELSSPAGRTEHVSLPPPIVVLDDLPASANGSSRSSSSTSNSRKRTKDERSSPTGPAVPVTSISISPVASAAVNGHPIAKFDRHAAGGADRAGVKAVPAGGAGAGRNVAVERSDPGSEADSGTPAASSGSSRTLPRPLPESPGPQGSPAVTVGPPAGASPRAAGAAAPPSGGVAASTYSSAFVRQLGSPVLQELLQGGGGGAAAATAVTPAGSAAPTPEELPYSERSTWGGASTASSLDAARVHPWSGGGASSGGGIAAGFGGGVGGTTLLTSMFTPPSSGPNWRRSGGASDLDGGFSGGGASHGFGFGAGVGYDGTSRSFDSASVASSLDAARIHPWSGGGSGSIAPDAAEAAAAGAAEAALAYNLQAADGSLELMAAVPSPSGPGPTSARASSGVYGEEYGSEGDAAGDSSGAGSARWGSGPGGRPSKSWLLLSPTVVVPEGGGGAGSSGRASSGTAAVRYPVTHAVVPSEEDADVDAGRLAGVEKTASVQQHSAPQQEQPASQLALQLPGIGESAGIAPAASAASPQRDGDADLSSGSDSTTPTPRADLSFAFHDASFALRSSEGPGTHDSDSAVLEGEEEAGPAVLEGEEEAEEGNVDEGEQLEGGRPGNLPRDGADGSDGGPAREWPVRRLILSDDLDKSSGGGGGAAAAAGGGGGRGSGGVPYDDEIMQTPTDAPWRPPFRRLDSGSARYDSDVSDVESSDLGGAGAAGGSVRSQGSAGPAADAESTAGGGRRQRGRQGRGTGGGGGGGGGDEYSYYDGYSEEDDECDDGSGLRESIGAGSIGGVSKALDAQRQKQRQQQQQQQQPEQRRDSSRNAGRPADEPDAADTFSFPSAAEPTDRTSAAAAAAAAALRSIVLAGAVSSGGGGGGTGSNRSSMSGLGSPRVSGTFDSGLGGSGGGSDSTPSFHSTRLARPSRIVVPSSPRSSLGGWSQPSPVPSPYTYGVVGVRTPSSGGAADFSLRKHLNLTVSSCLFGDSDAEDEEDDGAEEVEQPHRTPEQRRQRDATDDEVESGDEAESRLRQ